MRSRWIAGALACGLLACAPTLDWRETSPQASGIAALFPCRPDQHGRAVELAETRVRMEMLVCAAGGATYALSFIDVADPTRVTPVLVAVRAVAAANLGAAQPRVAPWQMSGMTPNPQAARVSFAGRLPDGAAVQQHSVFFSKGLRVYQASVIGTKPPLDAVETFFTGLKFPS